MRTTERFTVKPSKGKIEGGDATLIVFDCIAPCDREMCPIATQCTYQGRETCMVQSKYLLSLEKNFLADMGPKIDQRFLDRFSNELFPLYHQLILMKMYKAGLNLSQVFYETNGGVIKVHPVFQEIRNIIRAIRETQKSMGMGNEYLAHQAKVRGSIGEGAVPGDYGDPDKGDPYYYDRLMEESRRDPDIQTPKSAGQAGVKRVSYDMEELRNEPGDGHTPEDLGQSDEEEDNDDDSNGE